MGCVGHVVFCPRKTGSFSVARSWSLLQTPVLHTHNLYHFVVLDKKHSSFYDFVLEYFDMMNHVDFGDSDMVEYAIEVREDAKVRFLFLFFDSLKFVTTVRDPLARRISQFLQSVTVEQVNAVMDCVYPECKRLKPQRPDVAELCHFRQKMKRGSSCPIILDALDIVLRKFRLLNAQDILELFDKHFIQADITEFTEFFSFMQDYVTPDFDLKKVVKDGCDVQVYSFCGVDARHLLIKLENIADPSVRSKLEMFTGIQELGREHNSEASHHLFSYDVKSVKDLLFLNYGETMKRSKRDSIEGQIVSGLGY